jgi:predicted nucleotidyltransferase
MIALLEHNRTAMEDLCRRYGVTRLEVFGSAATGEAFDPDSDVDFLVEFSPPGPGRHADQYFGFLGELEVLLGRHVDLVVTAAIRNPYFLRNIDLQRELLYAA